MLCYFYFLLLQSLILRRKKKVLENMANECGSTENMFYVGIPQKEDNTDDDDHI